MEYVVPLAIFVIAFLAGWFAREKYAERTVNKYLSVLEESKEKMMNDAMHLKVHAEHGVFYIYNKESGSFITQVADKDELFDYFTKNYPNKAVLMSKDQLEMFDKA